MAKCDKTVRKIETIKRRNYVFANIEDDNRILKERAKKAGYHNIATNDLLTSEILGSYKYIAWNMRDSLEHFYKLYDSDLLELFKMYTFKLAMEYQEVISEI